MVMVPGVYILLTSFMRIWTTGLNRRAHGIYSECTVGNLYKYAPEMFYGRISAAGSTNGSLYAEAIKVIDYLNQCTTSG